MCKTGKVFKCDWCGKNVYKIPSLIRAHNFCNSKCQKRWQADKTSNHPNYRGGKFEKCEICGNEFYHDPYRQRKFANGFCSRKCYGLSKQKRIKLECPICGEEFIVTKCRLKRGKNICCSKKCMVKQRIKNNVKDRCKICSHCLIAFKPPTMQWAETAKYCSSYCYHLASRNKFEIQCSFCGIQIKVTPSQYQRHENHFCGTKCQSAFQIRPETAEPYCDIWLDKEYKDSIKKRDGNTCINPVCYKTTDKLSVHHIDYNKKNCNPSNLVSVCVSCNAVANFNRGWHETWYQAIMHRRYGYNYKEAA